uniref:Tudor domain-containing protein n=1 Tax=Syphacia muris TaxID=451379 RepID=A0A0N5ANH2_9BILA
MVAEMDDMKATCEGIICQVNKDTVDNPSFFVHIKTNECYTSKKLIHEALQNSASELVRVEHCEIEKGAILVVSIGESLLRCCFLNVSNDSVEVYLIDEGIQAMVKRDNIFYCPNSLKVFKIFCCIRPVLIQDVLPPQYEVARALIGFKCRFIGDEIIFCNGKPYSKGMVLVEYENGSFSDIKDIGTKPIEGRQCPHFKVEVEQELVNDDCSGGVRNNLSEDTDVIVSPVSSCAVESSGDSLPIKMTSIVNEKRELRNEEDQMSEIGQNRKCGRNVTKALSRKQIGHSEKRFRELLKLDSTSDGFFDDEKVYHNRNSFKEIEKNCHEMKVGTDNSFIQSSKASFKDYFVGRKAGDDSSLLCRGKWVDFTERKTHPLVGQRHRGSYFKSYCEGMEGRDEPFLKQKAFREFEANSYPCKMRMRFGRKEPGLRVPTFWIIDTVTFTNIEQVLHEGRVCYKQIPGFSSSRVNELVGAGCLASVFMDDMYILARAVITNFCEEANSFSVYLVDYGFYKTARLKDLIDISHINKADPVLTLPLSMLRCQLEQSSFLKLVELQRGSEYEFEILRRKSNGIYLVNANHLRNDDSVLSNSYVSKDVGFSSSNNSNLSHQVTSEYESIVKMLESKISLLGNNMLGNMNHTRWLSGASMYCNANHNMFTGMGYNSSPYPFLYWLNNFGYALPMFMPMVMPLAQQMVRSNNNEGVQDGADSQPKAFPRNSQNAIVQDDIGQDVDASYADKRRYHRDSSHSFFRNPAYKYVVRRNAEQDEAKSVHKIQSHDFERGRRSHDFKRDVGNQRKCSQQDVKKLFSFDGKENGGGRRSSFEFFSPKRKNSMITRKRNTPAFLDDTSSEWDVPSHNIDSDDEESEEWTAENRKHGASVDFF